MKVLCAILALVIAAAVATHDPAEARAKKKRQHAPAFTADQRARSNNGSDYQEAIADKLPFGSARWWRQMDAEGRGGQGRPN